MPKPKKTRVQSKEKKARKPPKETQEWIQVSLPQNKRCLKKSLKHNACET
jgi:hypothetical protein